LILPDTRHLRDSEVRDWNVIQPQWEELTVQGVSADGHTLTLGRALTYDHFGARDGNGTLDFLPHVGNLSRNITIRSEFLIGTGTQGHTLFTSRANIDVRYVAFRDLGRTQAAPTGSGIRSDVIQLTSNTLWGRLLSGKWISIYDDWECYRRREHYS
jgi:hypothetical protein